MLKINENIAIKSKELKYRSIKSSGPGGQNINKNSTAISLHFDISNSSSLSNEIKYKLLNRPNKYLTKTGKVIIKVNTYKSQNKNKSEAILRLITYFKDSIAHDCAILLTLNGGLILYRASTIFLLPYPHPTLKEASP